MKRISISMVVSAALLWGTQPLHALFLIDSFDSNQWVSVSGPPSGYKSAFDSLAATNVVGQSRDVFVERTLGTFGSVAFDANVSSNGVATFAQGQNTAGRAQVVWDGSDTASDIVYNGLGGLDMTQGGTNKYLYTRYGSDLGNVSIQFTFYTDSTNFSYTTVTAPANTLSNRVTAWVPLTNFTVGGGTGADFTKIGAVSMLIDGTAQLNADLQIDEVILWVPEPSSAVLALLGACGLALRRRRCRS